MLNFLLEDWMPWYKEERDFATIDVLRPIKGKRNSLTARATFHRAAEKLPPITIHESAT